MRIKSDSHFVVFGLILGLIFFSFNPVASTSTIFSDSYTSNSGWTKVGSEVYIGSGHVVISGIDGTDHHIYHSLGTTLNSTTAFKLDFDFTFSAANNPADYITSLQNDTSNPDFTGDLLGVGIGINGNDLAISYRVAPDYSHFSTSNIPVSANTNYYVTLERLNSTTAELLVFSNPARTVQISGSPIYQTLPSGLGHLSVLSHAVAQTGCTCRSFTGYVDNTVLTSSLSTVNLNIDVGPVNNGAFTQTYRTSGGT